jgi:hypothetical protein
MTDTTIIIGNIAIHEPVTAFTDLIITIFAFIYFRRLSAPDEATKNWRLFFLFISLSTLAGACSHGLFAVHEGIEYKSIWLSMQFLNGFAVYFAQKATLFSVLKDSKAYGAWKLSYMIQLLIYFMMLIIIQKYIITILDNAIGLIPIMILHFTAKDKQQYYSKVGYGILISFITAIVHATKFSLHAYFNYNDIAHIFIIISLTVMYLGIKQRSTAS